MTGDIENTLEQYETQGMKLQDAVNQVQTQQQTKQQTSNLLKEGTTDIIKAKFGVNKRHSRKILNLLENGGDERGQFARLEAKFDRWFDDVKRFVGTLSEETKTNRRNSQKLVRKFNRVERKVQLDTKLEHAIQVIRELQNMELVYNSELAERRKERRDSHKPTDSNRSGVEHPADNLSLNELIETGETECIEFKRAIPDSNLAIPKELVALATHRGGVLVVGVSDDGAVTGVDDIDGAEERVANIVRDTIEPAMSPEIETPSVDGKDLLSVAVSQSSDPPLSVNGSFYRRVGTTKQPLTGTDLKDLLS